MMKERRPATPDGGQGKDEAKLIARAKYDREAFGELYERHLQKIYTYLYYRTGNHADAEDLTSRVFQKAYVHLSGYEHLGLPFSAWLYRIAHNIVANWYRDQSRRKVVGLDEAVRHSSEEDPGSSAEKSDEQERLLQLIRKLPEEKQQVIILKFTGGYSNAEIGEILGRSEGAIKSLYHRTLLTLREKWVQWE
ncbi:MAG: sigma-70 family RNA polymerase sigma factor [Anaerolineales bacterium]|nr:sigma-70 family RNA polymerase sigma factor [Anaerolineales bacterium]